MMSDSIKEIMQRQLLIRDILLREWDPIGIAEYVEAQNEYNAYVAGIDSLIVKGGTQDEIFADLWRIETERMGLRGDRHKTELIAERLFEFGQKHNIPPRPAGL